jgi:acyl-coenzyme A thioesterase PaaI-like protein
MSATAEERSVQERFAPASRCFGCGPANPQGLRLRSFPAAPDGDELVARWQPEPHHEAFPGVLNGGIAGALLDCHGNWAAAWHLYRRDRLERPPTTVTADFHVHLKRPTPTAGPLTLRARAVAAEGDKVTVTGELEAAGRVTATVTARFVAVGPGHPAYGRT